MSDCKEVFTDIYARKVWGDGSGGGSDPERAQSYVDFIKGELGVSGGTVLDIGCGDGRLALLFKPKHNGWIYHGIDAAITHYCIHDPDFVMEVGIDALTDPLPDADLVLCKEVLQHLSNDQVELLLKRTDHYPRRLFTSITGEGTNIDIQTGETRPVDLSLPPFNRPARNVFTYGKGAYVIQEL